MAERLENLVFEDVDGRNMIWKNFRGKPSEYNTDGKRSFHLSLDKDSAKELEQLGWRIKWPKQQNEEGTLQPLLPVFIRFDVVPPNVWLINSKKKRLKLDEESISELDYAYITKFDLVVSPYRWEFGGKTGIKAYVKSMAVNVQEDPIEAKYSDYETYGDEEEVPFN